MSFVASPRRRTGWRPRLASLPLLLLLPALLVGPRVAGRAAAQAPAEPQVTVDLYGNSLSFRTLPSTLVTAELAGPGGRKAEGLGAGDAQGVAQVFFFTGDARILPGDTITLSRANDKPLRLTVPQLAASLGDLPRVSGLAPAGAALTLRLAAGGAGAAAVERTFSADAQGAFALDLGAELADPTAPRSGSLSVDTPEGGRFRLALATAEVQVTLGAPALRGRLTAGWEFSGTVTAPGGQPQAIGPVAADGSGRFVLPLGQLGRPLGAGDQLDLQARAPVGGWSEQIAGATQELSLELDRSADRARGQAPAGVSVLVTATDLDGREEAFAATADAAGAYAVDLGPRVSLASGWRVRAAYRAGSRLTVGRLAVLPRLRVGIGMMLSQGLAQPGRVMTVTLRSGTGATKALTLSQADDQGAYQIFFGMPGINPQPGDSLELAYADNAGDPLLLTIPSLTAASDVAADTVSGEAPAGARVTLRVDGAEGPRTFTAQADPGGGYRFDLAGSLDLVRPANGRVTVPGSGVAEFTTSWSAMQLNVAVGGTIQSAFIFGNGPSWQQVEAQLLAPDGKVVGSGSGQVFGGDGVFFVPGGNGAGPQFFMQPVDVTGAPVTMQPGDRLRVTAGGERVELSIPPLDAVTFVQSDRVTGRTAPDKRVILSLADSPLYFDTSAETRSDASGNFSHDFSGKRNIRHGDFLQLSVDIDGHLVSDVSLAPGLLLDLDQAVLLGAVAPGLEATVTLRRGTSTLSRQSTRTDGDGAMFVQFGDAEGRPLRLQVGDEVTVVTADPTQDTLSLTVPELDLTWDLAADTVGGQAPAQGQLTVFASLVYPVADTLGFAQGWPEVQPGNRFNTAFVPSIDVRPGSRLTLLFRPPQGHYVVRTRTVPILNAQHGGPKACGFGLPYQPASARLEAAGRELAAAAPLPAPYDGFIDRLLQDGAGQAVKSAAGQRESAVLGGPTAAIDLPTLDLAVDWNQQLVQGKGPANSTFTVAPAQPCAAGRPQGILNFNIALGPSSRTDAEGNLATFLPQGAAPGSGVELAFYTADGQRYFRQVYRAQARVYIRQDRVTGQANALDPVGVALLDAGGQERGRAAGAADGEGAFGLRLQDAAGAPRLIEAGDRLRLDAGGQTVELTVEPLAFDWSEGAPIFGTAQAGRPVVLRLRLKSGAVHSLQRQADAAGRFSFKAEDLPPRGGWTLDDVAAVRLELATAGGHLIIDQTPSWTAPGPDRSRPVIYLPAAYRGAAARGAALATAGGPSAVKPVAAGRAGAAAPAAGRELSPALRPAVTTWASLLGGALPTRGLPAGRAWPAWRGVGQEGPPNPLDQGNRSLR